MNATRAAAVLLALIGGCRCTSGTPPSAKAAERARKYIATWSGMGMWLPDDEQVAFFSDHLSDVSGALTSALSHTNPDVRQRAAYVITEIGPDARSLGPALASQLKAEANRLVRLYLYNALRATRHSDQETVSLLRDRFEALDGRNQPANADHSYSAVDEKISVAAALYVLDPDAGNRKEYLEFVARWLRPPADGLPPDELAGYWERRWCAVIALEHMPEASEVAPLLKAMLDEPNAKPWVSVHVPRVLKALAQGGPP